MKDYNTLEEKMGGRLYLKNPREGEKDPARKAMKMNENISVFAGRWVTHQLDLDKASTYETDFFVYKIT